MTRQTAQALSADLDWVLLKALAHNKTQRYASIDDFASDLRRYLNHETVSARRPTRFYHLRKFCRRRQGLAATFGAIGMCLGITLAGLIVHAVIVSGHTRQLVEAQRESDLQSKVADETVRFLTDEVLGQAAPGRLGPDARLSELLMAVGPQLPDRLGEAPEVAARVHFELGLLFGLLGDDERADAEFHQASLRLEEAGEENAPFAAQVAARHALILARQPNLHDEARRLVRRHLSSASPPRSLDLLDPADASQYRLWDALARIDDLGEDPAAGLALRQTVMESVRRGGGFRLGRLWLEERSNHVSSLVRAGEYVDAISAAEDLLDNAEQTRDLRTIQRVKLTLAQVYRVAGRIAEACEMSDLAASEAVDLYGATHPITIDSFMLSAFAHDVSGRRDRAIGSATSAFERSAQGKPGGRRWAESGSVLARILLDSGDDESRAGAVADELLAGWSPDDPAPEYLDGFSVSNLTGVLNRLGRSEEAEALSDSILARTDLPLRERFLVMLDRFHNFLLVGKTEEAEAAHAELEQIALSIEGRQAIVLRDAAACALGELFAARGEFESAEKVLLGEYEKAGIVAGRTAVARKLVELYELWGRDDEVARWQSLAGARFDPVILDELLRRYVEHSGD